MTADGVPAMTLAQIAQLPTVVDLVTAARALGVGRTTAYALARAGEFPCAVVRVGGTYKVPTIGLLRLLGLDSAPTPRPERDHERDRHQHHDDGTDGASSRLGLPRDLPAARA
jgi:hypothetical protein